MASEPIPSFFRFIFLWLDPAFCFLGMITHLFSSGQTLEGYSPSYNRNPGVEVIHVLDSMAGFFAMLGLMEAVLLRVKRHDPAVWRVFQGCASVLDWFMVYAAVKALMSEGRLDVNVWRGDDWRLVVGNLCAGLARTACALGIAFGRAEEETERKVKKLQ